MEWAGRLSKRNIVETTSNILVTLFCPTLLFKEEKNLPDVELQLPDLCWGRLALVSFLVVLQTPLTLVELSGAWLVTAALSEGVRCLGQP